LAVPVLLLACALPAGKVTSSGCIRSCTDPPTKDTVYELCVLGTEVKTGIDECSTEVSQEEIELCSVGESYPECKTGP
jgi:hypothetical protein